MNDNESYTTPPVGGAPVMPEPPAPKRESKAKRYALYAAAAFGLLVLGAAISDQSEPEAAPPPVVVTVAPPPTPAPTTEAPSPTEVAEPEPTDDPMDDAMADLQSQIYVQKACNTFRRAGNTLGEATAKTVFLGVVNDADTDRGDGTMGGSWLDVSATHDIGLSALYDEFLYRYC